MPNYLIIQRGPEIGKRITLKDGVTTIGRSNDNDIELNDPYVSRYHSVIKQEGDTYQLVDLGSENPVQIRDTALEPGEPYTLQHRDIIRIGQYIFSFQSEAGLTARASEAASARAASPEPAPVAFPVVEDAGATQVFSGVRRQSPSEPAQEQTRIAPPQFGASGANIYNATPSEPAPATSSTPVSNMPPATPPVEQEQGRPSSPAPVGYDPYPAANNWPNQPENQAVPSFFDSPAPASAPADAPTPAPYNQNYNQNQNWQNQNWAASNPNQSSGSANSTDNYDDDDNAQTVIGSNYADLIRQYKSQATPETPASPQVSQGYFAGAGAGSGNSQIEESTTNPIPYGTPASPGYQSQYNQPQSQPAYGGSLSESQTEDYDEDNAPTVIGSNYADLIKQARQSYGQGGTGSTPAPGENTSISMPVGSDEARTEVATNYKELLSSTQPEPQPPAPNYGSYGRSYNTYGTDNQSAAGAGYSGSNFSGYGQEAETTNTRGETHPGNPAPADWQSQAQQYGQQYGQYGQQYGQNQYGQQYGQPGQPQYGQPQYDPNQYGQYGQNQYGQSGQPQYGQPQYGQYGQPQYDPNQYGQYGQPGQQYGQPGQPQYDPNQYGQPQYGQPQYGQPQYGQPAQPQYGQPAQPQYGQPAHSQPGQGQGQAPAADQNKDKGQPAENPEGEDSPTAVIRFDKTKQ